MKENIAKLKSEQLAIDIIVLYKQLFYKQKETVLSKQLLRSGTSIGANLVEAECAISKKDFLSKVYISLKECAEAKYWLGLLYKTSYITKNEFEHFIKSCEELRKILSSTTKTIQERLAKAE